MMNANEYEGLVGESEPEVPQPSHARPDPSSSDRVFDPEIVARRMPNGRVLIQGRFLVDITLHRHVPPRGGPIWVACATLETNSGPLQWSSSVTEQEIARRIFGAPQGVAGFAGKRASGARAFNKQAVQRGAQRDAFRRVVGDVRRTLDSPAAQSILNATSAIPYVGPALQGVRAATTIVDNVANGDPRARARLAQLQRAARRGDPNARQAIGVVENVLRSQRRIAAQRGGRARRRNASPRVERAWREADRRWNEWRAAQARDGAVPAEPPIPPPRRRREP